MLEVGFARYDVDRDYGLMRYYAVYRDGERIGTAWVEPSAYVCGRYTAPEWVFSIGDEPLVRFPRDQEVLPEPYHTIRTLARQIDC